MAQKKMETKQERKKKKEKNCFLQWEERKFVCLSIEKTKTISFYFFRQYILFIISHSFFCGSFSQKNVDFPVFQ